MSIVGFNFTKISAERKNAVVGTININNNVGLTNVAETKLGLASGRGALRVSFKFISSYAPDFASLILEGDVIVLVDAKQAETVLESWKKGNQVPRTIFEPVMNHILDRCNVQALLLAKDLNLPSPVPLPKVQIQVPGTPKEEMKATKVKKK